MDKSVRLTSCLIHSLLYRSGDSKGFEGATSLRGTDGVLYVLGLCEGNHCAEVGMVGWTGTSLWLRRGGGR